jgi:hypothetical protein
MPMRAKHSWLLLAVLALPRPAMGVYGLNDYSVRAEYDRSAAVVTGKRYILFMYPEAGRLMVDNCGNSGPVSEKTEILRAVKRIARPRHPERLRDS